MGLNFYLCIFKLNIGMFTQTFSKQSLNFSQISTEDENVLRVSGRFDFARLQFPSDAAGTDIYSKRLETRKREIGIIIYL